MKNKKVMNLASLSDSRLLYDKKLPSFGYMIVIIVWVLLVAVLVWSLVTPKVYIIKGSGVVESDNKNYIMSAVSGEISEMQSSSGDYATEGEILFEVKSTDLDMQKMQVDAKIEILKKRAEQYEKLEQSIKDDYNYFDDYNPDDKQYYNQFEEYKSTIGQNQIDTSTYELYGYSYAQIKIEISKNQCKNDAVYYGTLKSIGEATNNILSEMEVLEAQAKSIAEAQADYEIAAPTSGIVRFSTEYKTGMVIQAGNAIGSIAQEYDDYTIKAYISASDVARAEVGDTVDIAVAGLLESAYGTIPGVLVYIDSDITMQNNNSQDTNEPQGGSFFKVEIKPETNYLVSRSGRKYNLSNGTAVEIRIKYDEITYFGYLMESIGLVLR